MWWLPVLGYALLFITVICCAWLSILQDRYNSEVENARILNQSIPEEPWYMRIHWKRFFDNDRR